MATCESPDYAELVDDRILTNTHKHSMDVKAAVIKFPKWRSVAKVLGVQSEIREANTPDQKDQYMDDDIDTWLRRAHNEKECGPPTWKKLVQAIADRIGGDDPAHAREIARAHPTVQQQATHPNVADVPQQATIAGDGAAAPNMLNGMSEQSRRTEVEETDKKIVDLQRSYTKIIRHTVEYMKSHVSIEDLRYALRFPLPNIRKKHKIFFEKAMTKVENAESIDDICFVVGDHCNYLSYSLLKHIIDLYGNDKLKKEMADYSKRMEAFRHETRLAIFCDVCDDKPEKDDSDFSTLVTKHQINWATATLEDVENVRKDVCRDLCLYEFSLNLQKIERGCVEITWQVPRSLVAYIQRSIKPSSPSMMKHHVSTLTIDGFIVYDSTTVMSPDAVVPLLPAQAEKVKKICSRLGKVFAILQALWEINVVERRPTLGLPHNIIAEAITDTVPDVLDGMSEQRRQCVRATLGAEGEFLLQLLQNGWMIVNAEPSAVELITVALKRKYFVRDYRIFIDRMDQCIKGNLRSHPPKVGHKPAGRPKTTAAVGPLAAVPIPSFTDRKSGQPKTTPTAVGSPATDLIPPSHLTGRLDIDRDILKAKEILKHLDKKELRDLFWELGLSEHTVQNHYSGSSISDYTDDLIHGWILEKDSVLEKGGATWKNLKKSLTKHAHAGVAALISTQPQTTAYTSMQQVTVSQASTTSPATPSQPLSATSVSQWPTAEDTLGIGDLFDIHYDLRSVASNWKYVGLALRLDPNTLYDIEADCRDVKSCLLEVLAKWLKKTYNTARYGPPSWQLLVAAVGHPVGGNNRALAQQIAEKHNVPHPPEY